MIRVGISVEGLTEEHFINRVLAKYFEARQVYLFPINLDGNISIDRVKDELKKLSRSYDYVTTLYDFYGFKRLEEGETKSSLENRILQPLGKLGIRNVFPYIQMYEFEGILFSSPEVLSNALRNERKDLLVWSRKVLQSFGGNPEEINNSRQTAPSKRLLANTNYKKTIDGPRIAKEIGINTLKEKCSGFRAWVTMIEGWASEE